MDFEQHIYGMTEEGEAVVVYILRADNGAEVHITNLGASIVAVKVPDSNSKIENVVLAQSDLNAMLRDRAYIGRTIDWSVGLRSLGLHNSIWESRFETNRVVMSLELEGSENLSVEAIFDFDDEMSLEVTYLAKCDAVTQIDISPNIFFNLSGVADSTLSEHELKINSAEFLPADELCPSRGETDIEKENYKCGILSFVAELRETESRRRVEILSSKDGLNLCRGDRSETIALTPRRLTLGDIEAGELYCEKNVYKFSTY